MEQFIPFLFRIFGSVVICLSAATGVMAYPNGAPAGYTGSPGDAHTCTVSSCHGGSAVNVSGWIISNVPAQGYTPGSVYTITATVTGSGKKGMEVSPQSLTGTQLGVLTAGSNNHLVGGTKYVTHNSTGSSSGTSTYNFTWTAPAAGTGTVTFYGAFIVGIPNTKLCTLVVNENAAIPLAATATATPPLICAGQSSQLNVTASGGSGTYTYSWTSLPAGFTSSIPNPMVTPAVTTQYIAHVSDGITTVDAPATVTVNQPPTAGAGNDTTCAYETTQVLLEGIADNYSSVLWTTSGTGTFSAANALTGYYLPSTADKDGGDVTLTLTASPQSPCTAAAVDSRIIHFEWPTGISDAHGSKISMVISPNPTNGSFFLRLNGQDNQVATLTISDICGRTILQYVAEGPEFHQKRIDLSGFPRGLYFVKSRIGTESLVQKLIVE